MCVYYTLECEDSPKYANKCAAFKANGYCEEGQVYYKSMQKFCAKTCELCSGKSCLYVFNTFCNLF